MDDDVEYEYNIFGQLNCCSALRNLWSIKRNFHTICCFSALNITSIRFIALFGIVFAVSCTLIASKNEQFNSNQTAVVGFEIRQILHEFAELITLS